MMPCARAAGCADIRVATQNGILTFGSRPGPVSFPLSGRIVIAAFCGRSADTALKLTLGQLFHLPSLKWDV